ncbi:MAG: hypothetical protein KatS3mg087_1779 [Patescibacteria group bacterium]|nr:MAG: hypothetical protein KatS3mg087_1779 [Patescibacteria group bacterium]
MQVLYDKFVISRQNGRVTVTDWVTGKESHIYTIAECTEIAFGDEGVGAFSEGIGIDWFSNFTLARDDIRAIGRIAATLFRYDLQSATGRAFVRKASELESQCKARKLTADDVRRHFDDIVVSGIRTSVPPRDPMVALHTIGAELPDGTEVPSEVGEKIWALISSQIEWDEVDTPPTVPPKWWGDIQIGRESFRFNPLMTAQEIAATNAAIEKSWLQLEDKTFSVRVRLEIPPMAVVRAKKEKVEADRKAADWQRQREEVAARDEIRRAVEVRSEAAERLQKLIAAGWQIEVCQPVEVQQWGRTVWKQIIRAKSPYGLKVETEYSIGLKSPDEAIILPNILPNNGEGA